MRERETIFASQLILFAFQEDRDFVLVLGLSGSVVSLLSLAIWQTPCLLHTDRTRPSPASFQASPVQQGNSSEMCSWPVENKAEGFLFRASAPPSAPGLQHTWAAGASCCLKDEGTKTDPDQWLVQLVSLPDVLPAHPCPFCHFSSHPTPPPFVLLIPQVSRSLLLSFLHTFHHCLCRDARGMTAVEQFKILRSAVRNEIPVSAVGYQ